MPAVQFDFCYFKAAGEPTTTAILTGIDAETGMVMATVVGDKQQDFQYHAQCSQSFLMECGRVQAVFNSTILQSDQEDHMIAVLQTAASKMGSNIIVRQSPAYSSQAQGSVDRFHRTLMGQIRTPRAQLQQNYDRTTASKHRIVPWLVRHPRIYSTGTQHTRIGNFPVQKASKIDTSNSFLGCSSPTVFGHQNWS